MFVANVSSYYGRYFEAPRRLVSYRGLQQRCGVGYKDDKYAGIVWNRIFHRQAEV